MGYRKGNMGIVSALLGALFVGMLVTMVTAMVMAALVSSQTVQYTAMNIGALAALLFGSIASSLAAAKRIGRQRLFMSVAGAGVYFLALLCGGVLLFDGVKSGVGVTALIVFAGALCVTFLGAKGEKRQKYKRPRMRL